jgi:hypothetical protein
MHVRKGFVAGPGSPGSITLSLDCSETGRSPEYRVHESGFVKARLQAKKAPEH